MSKGSPSFPSGEPDDTQVGAANVVQQIMNRMTPTVQRSLMLAGIGLAMVLVWLALRLATSGAAVPAPGAAESTPASTTVASATAPSTPVPSLAIVSDATATLAPPATLKPVGTKAPTRTPLPTQTPAPTVTPLPTATPTSLPVPDWRATGKLTSIEYINIIVIERERAKTGIGVVIPGQDRIVLQVVGNIHAGVDLNKIKPENVRINGKSIRLVLPHAEIISIELMPEASRIYEADQTLIFSDYEGLEIEAMDEARQKLRENSAHNLKMLEMAETLARLQLTELLRSLGYEQIEIVFE